MDMLNNNSEWKTVFYIMGSLVIDRRRLFMFSFSVDHSACGNVTKGGNNIDNGLDDERGDVFIHPFDCGSGDKRQAVDEGGVSGVHIGASGDKEDDAGNNGIGRFVERASKYNTTY